MAQVIGRALLVLLLAVVCQGADSAGALEFRVKAAFLLNFAKFVEWPVEHASSNEPFSICVIGTDPFGNVLDQVVQGEAIGNRKLVVQRLAELGPARCEVVYVSKTVKEVSTLLESVGPGILTVGEGGDFLRAGGMIAFAIDNRRVRFDVSRSAARTGGVRLSSRLLNVARSVEK